MSGSCNTGMCFYVLYYKISWSACVVYNNNNNNNNNQDNVYSVVIMSEQLQEFTWFM